MSLYCLKMILKELTKIVLLLTLITNHYQERKKEGKKKEENKRRKINVDKESVFIYIIRSITVIKDNVLKYKIIF